MAVAHLIMAGFSKFPPNPSRQKKKNGWVLKCFQFFVLLPQWELVTKFLQKTVYFMVNFNMSVLIHMNIQVTMNL